MARLKKHTDALPEQRNIRGRIIVQNWRGLTVAKAWPRPRGPSSKPSENWWRGTFGTAAQMASQPFHLDQDFAVSWTKGTKFRPEDLLISAALGKLFEIVDPTGTIKGSVLDMASNPQATLDLITNLPGSILLRAPQGWIGVPPGNGGQVLTFGTTGELFWASVAKKTGIPTQSNLRLGLDNDLPGQDLSALYTVQWDHAAYDTDNRWSPSPNPAWVSFGPDDVGRIAAFDAGFKLAGTLAAGRVVLQLAHFDSAIQIRQATGLNIQHPGGTLELTTTLQTLPLLDGDIVTLRVLVPGATNATINARDTYAAMRMLS